MERTQVVIIGGGCTGTGILRDLALRGVPAVLFEKKDLAFGATGRCHGLLHSGARYAVKDGEAAKECIEENRILKKIAPSCIEDTGGMFVHLQKDDTEYISQFVKGCKQAGIPIEELSPAEVHLREPNVTTRITRAYTVPDAHIDVFQLTAVNAQDAIEHGAAVRTYTEIVGIDIENKRVTGVRFKNVLTGEAGQIKCEMVVNAAGPWGAMVAAQVGVQVNLICNRGSLVVFNQRLTRGIVNRLKAPGDCDLIVPGGPVSILGTTSVNVAKPDDMAINPGEVSYMLALAAATFPELNKARMIRVFAGIRPLYSPKKPSAGGAREISRNFVLLDHSREDQLEGFVSILGGKLTTYRLMAQVTSDLVCSKLGINRECETHKRILRPSAAVTSIQEAKKYLPLPAVVKAAHRLGNYLPLLIEKIKHNRMQAEILCECEFVTRGELELVVAGAITIPALTVGDIGRRTRLGFGTCQGSFCAYKAMIAVYEQGIWSGERARNELIHYLNERWKGQEFVLSGKQSQQLALSRQMYEEMIGCSSTANSAKGGSV